MFGMGICYPGAHSAVPTLLCPVQVEPPSPRALCSVPAPGTLRTHWSHWAGTVTNRAGTVTNTSVQDRAHQGQSARRWHESTILAESQAPGEPESPERSQGTATEASWQPDILKTSVDKVGISPWAGQCLHCVSPAEFPDLHIPRRKPGECSQEKAQLCQHSTAGRSLCPGNPHLQKRSQTPLMCQHLITAGVRFKSFPFCRVFCFQKHTLRKKKKSNSAKFLPPKNNNHGTALLL